MAEVKLIDVVRLLKMRGHNVQYSVRNDGSIRITKLDGVSYRGSVGNAVAREMAGVTLSESRKKQLETIKTEKGKFGHKKKSDLPEEVMKKIRRVQRKWKKSKVKREGYVGKRGARYNIEHYGEEEALRILEEQERYATGLAYTEVIEWIRSYIKDDIMPKVSKEDKIILEEIRSLIKEKAAIIKEADIAPIHDALYDYRDGKISAGTLKQLILSILV